MKKYLFLAIAAIVFCIPSWGQIKTLGKAETTKVASARMGVINVYHIHDNAGDIYYLGITTTNQFDDKMLVSLGTTVDEALQSLNAFVEMCETMKRKEAMDIVDADGVEWSITKLQPMGGKQLSFSGVGFAGDGAINKSELEALVKDLAKKK